MEVTDAVQLSSDDKKRVCHATIRTNKGNRIKVSFTAEQTESGDEVYFRLSVDDPTGFLR